MLRHTALLQFPRRSNEKPSENGSGTIQTDDNSSNKELDIGNAIPEISITDVSAFTYKYDSELEGMVVTDYLRESPKVRIPDKFEGEPVVKVNFSKLEKELTQLVMPNSVKDFELSSKIKRSLQYVNIPNSVTKIGSSAFSGCTGLTSITIPDSVTEIGYEAFFHCTGLTSVTIPDSVTWIGVEAFYDCTGLTKHNNTRQRDRD